MNLKSIKIAFTANKYKRFGEEEPELQETGKPLTHKDEKYAAVLYRQDTNGKKVASLDCLPHVIRFLEHEKIPPGCILKLRTDMHGRVYLPRDKYRQQRSSVMDIPVNPGNGQRDATNFFAELVIEANALKGLSPAGEKAVEQLNSLTNGIEVRDSEALLMHFRQLHQAIQELASSAKEVKSDSSDRSIQTDRRSGSEPTQRRNSRQTIETYTPANDPHHVNAAAVPSNRDAVQIPLNSGFVAETSDLRTPYGQPDPGRARAKAVRDAFRTASPVVLPKPIVDQMNEIIDTAQSSGNDEHQIRLDADTVKQPPAPAKSKKRWPFGKKS
jgi:hypothetical protein